MVEYFGERNYIYGLSKFINFKDLRILCLREIIGRLIVVIKML